MSQDVRAIDWGSDCTDSVVRKIRAAEGHPGVLDTIEGTEFHLFGAHHERALRGRPGEIIAQRTGAICRATVDGAVWITHLKRRDTPTERSSSSRPRGRSRSPGPSSTRRRSRWPSTRRCPPGTPSARSPTRSSAGVGYLHFDFYNGAMSTEQCRRLHEAYLFARSRRETKVIVLMGGSDFFSNGIHLNVIEAAEDPAAESWRNLRAIDDLVREIIETDSHLVLSALAGDAAAGGVPFALAADHVVAREDVVLNPYYQHMGGLYGSEYWTYLLPRRVGAELTARLTGPPFTPSGTRQAVEIGLLDAAFGATAGRASAPRSARWPSAWRATRRSTARLEGKRRRRARDEAIKPLNAYRREELARSYECFFGEDRSYHEARRRFVYKLGAPCAVAPAAAMPAHEAPRAGRRAA